MAIGEKISFRRKELGLTQEEVCYGIISTAYYSKLENNKFNPTHELLEVICNRLTIPMEQILQDDSEAKMEPLRAVHRLLENRDISLAENQMKPIFMMQNHRNPLIQLAFKINLFVFYLLKKEPSYYQAIKEELDEKANFLNDELEIWYFKALALYEFDTGHLNHSLTLLNKAQEIAKKVSLEDAHLDYFLGIVSTRLMKISISMYHIERAMKIYDQEVNLKKIIDCKIILAINYNKIQQYKMAENLFLQIASQLDEQNDHSKLGLIYHNLGYINSLSNKTDLSVDYYQKALQVKKNPAETFNTIYLLAVEYKKLGLLGECAELCQFGLEKSVEHDQHYHYKLYILNESLSPSSSGFHSPNFIYKLKNEIIPYFTKQDPTVASDCYRLLAALHKEQFKYKQAAKYYEKALDLQNKRKELLF